MVLTSSICSHLDSFESQLKGRNYTCHFRFEQVCEGNDLSLARSTVYTKYYPRKYWEHELDPVTQEEFLEEISKALAYRGDSDAGLSMTENQEIEFRNLLKDFMQLLQQAFNSTNCDIYAHPPLGYWVYWEFCFLLVEKESNAIYLLEGGSSD